MKAIDLIKLSTRMFKARTSRTLLTVLGMSVGIGAILFLVSLGYGLQKTLLEKITTADSLLTLDVSGAKSGVIDLNLEVVEKIKVMDGIAEISPSFQVTSQGHMNDISADLTVNAVEPTFLRLGGYKMSKGKMITDNNLDGIIINSAVAQVFGKSVDDVIGQEINFTFFVPEEAAEGATQEKLKKVESDKKYKIIGVIEGDENAVFVHSKTLTDLEISKYNALKVKCVSDSSMKITRDKILDMGLLVSSLSDTVDQANQVFSVIQIILLLFGMIALIVSAIGMFNTMTVTLLERTEEIGIMKSIGASNTAVSMMFVTEATVMGFLGGLVGIIMGYLGGKIFNLAINLIAMRFGGESVSLFYSPMWFVMFIVVSGAVVGFLTGVVPARRASKIDPLDALRYK